RIQPEYIAVLPDSLHHLLPLTDGPGHRLLTPNVLPHTGRFSSHDPMPVRRRGNMHDIHLRKLDEFAEISQLLYTIVAKLLHGQGKVTGVHVTYRYRLGTSIAEVPAPHPTYTDYSLGQVITRWQIPLATK